MRSTTRRHRSLVAAFLATTAFLATVPTAPAQAATSDATTTAPRAARPAHPSCDTRLPGRMACLSTWAATPHAERRPVAGASVAAGVQGPPRGYLTPADVRAAYRLPAKGGAGITIGIVDAYDYPSAERDLAVYRRTFGIPACTTASHCFRKVNQRGGTKPPKADAGWATETALDLQAVSATCPSCRILLVEADDTGEGLGAAVDTAVRLGARIVSNSYGGDEYRGMSAEARHYRHPGVAILASSGDDGYTTASFPAVLPDVWAVGGTTLTHSRTGWHETAWRHSGSACSLFVRKPKAQKDPGCSHRTVADVSVVAERFAVYDTFGLGEDNGWIALTGTSLSSPLLAGMMGLAGHPRRAADPSYAYAHRKGYRDVVGGRNGLCENYLCQGTKGYDGPTGVGSPNGLAGL